jgi:hypothetical protein
VLTLPIRTPQQELASGTMKTPSTLRRTTLSAKINASAAVAIFRARSGKRTLRDRIAADLAAEHGITPKAVRDVWNLRTWTAATQPEWTPADHERWAMMHGTPGQTPGPAEALAPESAPPPSLAEGPSAAECTGAQGPPMQVSQAGTLPAAPAGVPSCMMQAEHQGMSAVLGAPELTWMRSGETPQHLGASFAETAPCMPRHPADRLHFPRRELRMIAGTNEPTGTWAVPMMRQQSCAPMGHVQGHTGTAGDIVGRACPALGHKTAARGGAGSSVNPTIREDRRDTVKDAFQRQKQELQDLDTQLQACKAAEYAAIEKLAGLRKRVRELEDAREAHLSQAQSAEAASAMLQQNRGLTHVPDDLPAPAANALAPSCVGGGETVDFYSGPRARPSGARASTSLPNLTTMMRTPGDGAGVKTMDGPSWSPGPVHGADDISWGDRSTAQDAMNVEDAAIAFLPFTFQQSLHRLSGRPLPPDFHMPDELDCGWA